MSLRKILYLTIIIRSLTACKDEDPGVLELQKVFVGSTEINLTGPVSENLPVDRSISLIFSLPADQTTVAGAITLQSDDTVVPADISFSSSGETVVMFPNTILNANTVYTISVSDKIAGRQGETFHPVQISFKTEQGELEIVSVTVGGKTINGSARVMDVPLHLGMTINFSVPVDDDQLKAAVKLTGPNVPSLICSFSDENRSVEITSASPLRHLSKFIFSIPANLTGASGENFSGFSRTLYTTVDLTPKFPVVSDDALLTLVQEQTFKYFWDFAHPASGMARERNSSGDLVTSGGSGFALMAIITGIERNFITRGQGLARLDKILGFLETADRFHGAWPHWLDGNTGKVIPFSTNDNGGDLVETSFLVQGLLTFRQYLDTTVPAEQMLIDRINDLWETVEWDWYTRNGEDVLYWHWSPDKEWIMNHPIRGYNESLITYVLAAASPMHRIDKSVYTKGWAFDGGIVNGKSFYGIQLPLGYDYGGPLFFAHYSFLGLDPRNLSDEYASYWTQNVHHTLINYQYCSNNPKGFVNYNDQCWGLTASDNHQGYSAHSPTNDLGVISPTAALSSFPYTPDESMKALKFFYYTLGDQLWGPYGFFDAFNITEGWTAGSYLAIDQGPIIIMIENYRTGLLWDLFVSAPEVQDGLTRLDFIKS